MKKVKAIVLFFMFFLLFAGMGELQRQALGSNGYTDRFPQIVLYDINGEKLSLLCELCEKNGCAAFCSAKSGSELIENEIVIYTFEKDIPTVKMLCRTQEREYKSLFSGNVSVRYADIREMPVKDGAISFSFSAERETVGKIKEEYARFYKAEGVILPKKTDHRLTVAAFWLLITLVLLLFTRFELKSREKEYYVRLSLGDSAYRMAAENIAIDTALLAAAFFTAYLVWGRFTYTGYLFSFQCVMLCVSAAVNALSYLSIFSYDGRKALSRTDFSAFLLADCYLFKALVMMTALAAVTLSFTLIRKNRDALLYCGEDPDLSGYSFVSVGYREKTGEALPSLEKHWAQTGVENHRLFREKYAKGDVRFSFCVAEEQGRQTLMIDRGSVQLLDGIREAAATEEAKDFTVLYPEELERGEVLRQATELLKGYFPQVETEASCDAVSYTGKPKVLYFDSQYELSRCRHRAEQPVVILCSFTDRLLKSALPEDDSAVLHAMMYRLDEGEPERIEKVIRADEDRFTLSVTPVDEKCAYARKTAQATVSASVFFSLLMLLFDFFIIGITAQLEYQANSLKISLKKVFGYSMAARNREHILLTLFTVLIAVVTVVLGSILLRQPFLLIALTAGRVLLVPELLISVLFAVKLDRTDIPKMLKKGSM